MGQARAIREQVCRVLNDDHPTIVLVGNKIDIPSRQVEKQESVDLVGSGAKVQSMLRLQPRRTEM